MNKITLSILALGALASSAFAEVGDADREGVAEFFVTGTANKGTTVTNTFVAHGQDGLTAFQKAQLNAKMELSDR